MRVADELSTGDGVIGFALVSVSCLQSESEAAGDARHGRFY
jgi:hypothetical protein